MMNATSGTRIDLPGAPAIPGLWFHPHRGEPDFASHVAVINASYAADGLEYRMSVEQARQIYEHLVNCDPRRDFVLAEVDGVALAYAMTDWRADDEGMALHRSRVNIRPEWRGKGIEEALLHYLAGRILEIAAGHPPEMPRMMAAFAAESETWWNELLQHEGYAPVRYFFDMRRPTLDNLPEASLPAWAVIVTLVSQDLEP